MEEKDVESLLQIYKDLQKHRDIIKSIDKDFFFDYIGKLIHIIEGKDCVIETQAHNEEVLMEYFNRHTCLHCGKGKPEYCEDCYQKLIAENLRLQEKINELYHERLYIKES